MYPTIQAYRNAHLWLIVPIVVILIGFMPSYFLTFATESWGHHLHALSAIAWFGLMIAQPYLITRGNRHAHRLWGMIGLFLAGAVMFSALSISPLNVYLGAKGGFPPAFPAAFYYGIIFPETLGIIGFGLAVIMAIMKAKQPQQHAIWMTSTVFFALLPAWGRMWMAPVFIFQLDASPIDSLYISVPVFLLIIAFVGYRLKKLTHPSIILAILVNSFMMFTVQIGSQTWYQDSVTALMKPLFPW